MATRKPDNSEPLNVPPISVTEDDMAPRRRSSQAPKARANKPSNTAVVPAKKASNVPLFLVSIIAIAAVLIGAYLFLELQKLSVVLDKSMSDNMQQQKTLSELQERLSVTGENANLSVDALKSILKEHDSEIRKLWDVANKRNKSNIASNERSIGVARKSIESLKKTLALTSSDLDKNKEDIASIREDAAQMTTRVTKVEAASKQLPPAAELAISQNRDQGNRLTKDLASLRQQFEQMSEDMSYDEIVSIKLAIEDLQVRINRLQGAQ